MARATASSSSTTSAASSCDWCRAGEYRHCEATDWRTNPDARRYGYTSADNPYHLWGGFAQYMYLPWNAVLHKVPDGVTAELAGLVTPLSNGIEWALFDGGVGYDSTVLIQGPGQQGLSQTVACKQAGASLIIVTGTTRDAARLELAQDLGADHVIDVQAEDPLERVMELTGGKGVDFVLDCTVGRRDRAGAARHRRAQAPRGHAADPGRAGRVPRLPGQEADREGDHDQERARPQLPRLRARARTARAPGRFPLERLATHTFGLTDVDRAIRAIGGDGGDEDVIHVSLLPWLGGREHADRRPQPAARRPGGR